MTQFGLQEGVVYLSCSVCLVASPLTDRFESTSFSACAAHEPVSKLCRRLLEAAVICPLSETAFLNPLSEAAFLYPRSPELHPDSEPLEAYSLQILNP